MNRLDEIQDEHADWVLHNFPNATPVEAVLGVSEEAGELSHGMLKEIQGIRGNDHIPEMRDAIGDICIYLLHLCNLMGWSLLDIVDETWRHVQQRDWVKFPVDGRTK